MRYSPVKRLGMGILAAVMLLSLTLSGCQNQDTTSSTTTQPTTAPVEPIPEGAAVTKYHTVSDYSALSLPAVDAIVPGDFCIAKDGAAKATIVIAANAETKVQEAANDLAANLKVLTGADFNIVTDNDDVSGNRILVGASKKTDELGITFPKEHPGQEMFRVIAGKDVLVLGGNDAGTYTGTKFAVTYLLEALGFGWFGETGGLWDVVPKQNGDVFAASCDIASQSCFTSRYTRLCNYDKALTERWYVGGVKNITEHMLYYYLPRSMYAEHPEYFAFSQGTRDPAGKRFFQPCLSNPELQDMVAQKVIAEFAKNPDLTIASIGQQDGTGNPENPDYANWCECDDCKAFAPDFTQALMKFANIIGRKIKDECPGKAIMFYGYFATFTAPTDIDFQAEDNVILMLCKEGGLTKLIENGDLFNDWMEQPQFKDNFENWKKLGYRIAIYEWNCPGANDNPWKDTYWIQGDVFLGNLKWFKDHGVEYLYVDQTSIAKRPEDYNACYERTEDFMSLRWPLYYMSARSMWDCGLSFREIMMPACQKLFGPAANDMYSFYYLLNQENMNCEAPNFRWTLPRPYEIYDDPSMLIDAELLLESALEKAEKAGGAVLERVQTQVDNWALTMEMVNSQA